MEAGKIILDLIGENNLVSFAARDIRYGRTDRKTHYGYLEFVSSNQPKFTQEIVIQIQWTKDEDCFVLITDPISKKKLVVREGIECENLVDTLYEILG